MDQHDHQGVLMHGIGRRLVFSRPRGWFGMNFEIPRLLSGISIPPGATCLDIASGIGWASAGVARREGSARIIATDYDEAVLPQARRYLDSHGAAQTSLCRADGKHLPFRTGAFDLVLCLYGLHHVLGYREALGEIARVLNRGGKFALIDPIRKSGTPPGGHHGTEMLTVAELVQMFTEAGLECPLPQVSFGRVKAVASKIQ
jgi:ubiquinone/menaquinone biosynthesis C-methylase UbiE